MQEDFERKKSLLEREIADTLLKAVSERTLDLKDLRATASEILLDFEKIASMEEMRVFVDTISKKWKFFENLGKIEQGAAQVDKEKAVIDKLSQYIKTLN